MNIAQIAETLKQALAGLLHRLPFGVGIERDDPVGQGAAAAQRDPQVMHWVGAEIVGNVLTLI